MLDIRSPRPWDATTAAASALRRTVLAPLLRDYDQGIVCIEQVALAADVPVYVYAPTVEVRPNPRVCQAAQYDRTLPRERLPRSFDGTLSPD